MVSVTEYSWTWKWTLAIDRFTSQHGRSDSSTQTRYTQHRRTPHAFVVRMSAYDETCTSVVNISSKDRSVYF